MTRRGIWVADRLDVHQSCYILLSTKEKYIFKLSLVI